jgi:hypothetical protein
VVRAREILDHLPLLLTKAPEPAPPQRPPGLKSINEVLTASLPRAGIKVNDQRSKMIQNCMSFKKKLSIILHYS